MPRSFSVGILLDGRFWERVQQGSMKRIKCEVTVWNCLASDVRGCARLRKRAAGPALNSGLWLSAGR